jgi:hypothetical protein
VSWRQGLEELRLTRLPMLKHLDGDSYLVSVGNTRRYQIEAVNTTVDPENDGDIDVLLLGEEVANARIA